jgi:hypothetical protein
LLSSHIASPLKDVRNITGHNLVFCTIRNSERIGARRFRLKSLDVTDQRTCAGIGILLREDRPEKHPQENAACIMDLLRICLDKRIRRGYLTSTEVTTEQ